MFEVIVETIKGTSVAKEICREQSCFLGKASGCFVVLQGWSVAKEHAKIYSNGNGIYIRDNSSKSGTFVNDERIINYGPLQDGDVIRITSYNIRVSDRRVGAARTSVNIGTPTSTLAKVNAGPEREVTAPKVSSQSAQRKVIATAKAPDKDVSSSVIDAIEPIKNVDKQKAPLAEENLKELVRSWREIIHFELLKQMDLRRINVSDMSDDELRSMSKTIIDKIVVGLRDFPNALNRSEISKQVLDEAVGLGPLEELLEMDGVSEIMVNAADEIFYEKGGKLFESTVTFTNDKAVLSAIERIVTPLGRRIDESSPAVDARLKDGSRVNAIIPPIALKGPCITIRRFMKERLTADHLIGYGSISKEMVEFLENAVTYKQNAVISGGTGSGKTTLLNVLSNFIPDDERIITVEDAAELKLSQANLISLEARPANQEGKGAVPIRELVKNCLRMRPDRIVVGECRGGEALDMLQAMNTGHDGSLTTAHANNPRDCIARLEIMVMMAGMELPILAIREQIASAVNIVVQQTRFACGTRKVTSICEINGVEGSRIQLGEIFRFNSTGFDKDGKVLGQFEATGIVPDFYEKLSKRGINVDMEIFSAGRVLT